MIRRRMLLPKLLIRSSAFLLFLVFLSLPLTAYSAGPSSCGVSNEKLKEVISAKRADVIIPNKFRTFPGAHLELEVSKEKFDFTNKLFQVCYTGKTEKEADIFAYIPNVIANNPTADKATLRFILPADIEGGWLSSEPTLLRVIQMTSGTDTVNTLS